MKTFTAVMTILVSCGLMAGRAGAQDPVKVAPKMNKVLVDNDHVRVLDVRIKPGEKMPMHSHPDNVLYVLKGGTSKSTDPKGKVTTRTSKDGECLFRKAETHEVTNSSNTELHVLNIELKR
jgi:quercetin dioxygenase-like cupin family protein